MRHSTVAVLGLFSLAFAAPPARDEITVVWQHEKGTASTGVIVYNADETLLYGEQCGDKIDTGAFSAKPISFDVDENGFGSLTYGEKVYKVHSVAEHSGGITCFKRYNGNHARVDCTVPAQQTYKATDPTTAPPKCFSGDLLFGSIRKHTHPEGGFLDATTQQTPKNTTRLTKRQSDVAGETCDVSSWTELVGDGNPHQNFLAKQLSDTINCGNAATCSASQSQSKSYSIGFSADATYEEWISGGFSVEMSWETGNEYVCGGSTGETVCTWYQTAHTAYTVVNCDATTCDPECNPSDPFVMFSPNHNNAGGGYYCVTGTCRAQGDSYWNFDGPAGGPPF